MSKLDKFIAWRWFSITATVITVVLAAGLYALLQLVFYGEIRW